MIDRRDFFVGAGASIMLGGCATTLESRREPLPGVRFESLLRQIKHDVGSYIFRTQDDSPEVRLRNNACVGDVSFQIQSVKLTVTAQVDQTADDTAGLTIPLDVLTINPSAGIGRTLNNSITTSVVIYPMTASREAVIEDAALQRQRLTAIPPASPEFEGTPIANALTQLRQDMIAVSDTPPCFNFGTGDKGNVVKWAFAVTRRRTVGAKLNLLIFSVGTSDTTSTRYANEIEVAYIAAGEGFG
jgi:hypothetical protein